MTMEPPEQRAYRIFNQKEKALRVRRERRRLNAAEPGAMTMEHREMTVSNCNDWDTHSPGPWAAGEGVHCERIYSSGGVLVAMIDPAMIEEEVAMKEADARLIAAAPDLLLQLKEARQYVAKVATDRAGESLGTFASRRLDRMDAAIAKAEGGEE